MLMKLGPCLPVVVLLLSPSFTSAAATVRESRPRIWLSQELRSELQTKIRSGGGRRQFRAVKDYANQYFHQNGITVLRHLLPLYALDPEGNRRYGQRACEIAAFAITDGALSDGAWKGGNQNRWYTPWIAITYDWAHDICTEAQMEIMRSLMEKVYPNNINHYALPSRVANNIGAGFLYTNVLVSLALYGDHPDAGRWFAEAYEVWQTYYPKCLNSTTVNGPDEVCAGGSWPEGVEYAPETKYIHWEMMEAIRTATVNTDPFQEAPNFVSDLLYYHLHATSPAKGGIHKEYEPFLFRDLQKVGHFWQPDRQLMIELSYHLRRTGQTTLAKYAKYWLDNRQPYFSPLGRHNIGLEWLQLLWLDQDYPAEFWGAEPKNHITPFMLLARSDWSEDATWVGFLAMRENHDHLHGDAGSFQVYRKGKWITQEIPGYGGGPQVHGFSHNHLFTHVHTSWGGAYRPGEPAGMGHLTRVGEEQYRAECPDDGSYCYAQADMSDLYRFHGYNITPDMEWVYRDFLYIQPDWMVVADKVKYGKGVNGPMISSIQALSEPEVAGGQVTLASGDQRLYVNVVRPSDPVIHKRDRSTESGTRYVQWAWKLDDNRVGICVDDNHRLKNGGQVTLDGITGQWSVLNDRWDVTVPKQATGDPTASYKDGQSYWYECFLVQREGAFASLSEPWDLSQNIAFPNLRKSPNFHNSNRWYVAVTSTDPADHTSQFMVLQSADEFEPAKPVTAASASDGLNVARFDGNVVAAITTNEPVFPLRYEYDKVGPHEHYVLGLEPNGSYGVVHDDDEGILITPSGDLTASAAGVLRFRTPLGDEPVTRRQGRSDTPRR